MCMCFLLIVLLTVYGFVPRRCKSACKFYDTINQKMAVMLYPKNKCFDWQGDMSSDDDNILLA